MSQRHENPGFESTCNPGPGSLIEALERDGVARRAASTPEVPSAFVGAVTRRRHARWAISAGVTMGALAGLAAVLVLIWSSPVEPRIAPHIVQSPQKAGTLSPVPTVAELARVNRGRSGDALVLPEASGLDAAPLTAGTRPDSPAAAQIVR